MDGHNMHGGPGHYRDMQEANQGGMGGPMMMNQGMKSNGEHSNFMDGGNLPMHMKQDTKHDYGVPGMHQNPNAMHFHKQLHNRPPGMNQMPGQLQKKPMQRKPLPIDKKNNQPKSPSVKRQKEV